MNKRKFLNKVSAVLMLGLVVGSTVAPTALSASEIAKELDVVSETNSEAESETVDTNAKTTSTSDSIENIESDISNEESIEKEANAPNDIELTTGDMVTYNNQSFEVMSENGKEEDLSENFFIDENGVKRYPEYDNHSRDELEKIAKENDSRTYVREDGSTRYIYYTVEDAEEIKSTVDENKIAGSLTYQDSLERREDMEKELRSASASSKAGSYNYTMDISQVIDFSDIDASGYGDFYAMYINDYFMFCIEPTVGQLTYWGGTNATIRGNASEDVARTAGAANALYDETNDLNYYWAGTYLIYEQIGFSDIAPSVPSYASSQYNDLSSAVNNKDYELLTSPEFEIGDGSYQAGTSVLGVPTLYDPFGGVKVIKTFNNTSNQEVAEVCSQIDIKVVDSLNVESEKTMTQEGSSCVAEWPIDGSTLLNAGPATVTESRNDSPYWIIKDGTENITISEGEVTTVSGNSGIVNQTSVTDLTVSKTLNDNSNQANVLSSIYPDIKVTLAPTGSTPAFKNAASYTNQPLNSSGKHTFQNLVPGTYKLTETYPAYMGGITESRNITIDKNGSTSEGSQSTTLVNELKVSDVVAYKDLTNSTSIDSEDIVNPEDIKVTITPTGDTPVFNTNTANYKNQPLAWPTTAQQSKYGVDADEPIHVFNNLVPGTYQISETYPDYLGGVTTTANLTVSNSDSGIASDNSFKVPSGHLVNKVIAGNVKIEKDWDNEGLNSNIDEDDVINSSNEVSPSDFQVKIEGTKGSTKDLTGLYNETFTFDNNYMITTPAKSMPYGNYKYTEINNSGGAHEVINSGTFAITSDGQTVDLTNDKIKNDLDLGNINVEKTINMGDIEQFCSGTTYDDIDGNSITVTGDDCLEFVQTNVVANGDVEVTITSDSSNGFAYSETKPLKWSGTTYGTSFSGLPVGSYTITESFIAGQMQGVTTSQTVNITSDGQTVTASNFENDVLYGRFEISKRDTDTGGLIGGGIGGNSDKRATFAIWDYDVATGEIVGDTPIDVISTNLDGKATSRWIPLLNTGERTVFVQEVEAPDGYFLNGVETPDLKEGGYVYTLTAGNHKETVELTYDDVEIEDGEIKITKVITNTDNQVLEDEALEGFEFTIFNNVEILPNFGEIADGFESQIGVGEKLPQILLTDNFGEALSNKLVANYSENSINNKPVNGDMEYLISETGVPEGFDWMYIKPDDKEFTMTEDNIVYNFSFVNILKDLIINIDKVDENGSPVEGVEFTVYDNGVQDSNTGKWAFNNSDIVGTYITDENGQIQMDKMPVNKTYYVVETATKLGEDGHDMYYYSEDPIIFTPEYIESITNVDTDVIEVTETVTNDNKVGNIELNKYDDLGQKYLSGAEFSLTYDYNGEAQEETYTVDETLNIEDLYVYNSDGSYITYTLTETKAPNGYYVIEPFTFHFEQDGNGNIVVILNDENDAVEVNQSDMVGEVETGSEVTSETKPSFFALFNNEENNINSTMNVYDKRIVVDLNLLKLTEDAETLDAALNVDSNTDIQTPDTGMIQIDEDGNIVEDNSVNLDDKIEAHTPNDSSRLAGAEFEFSTYFDRSMLSTYGYEVVDGVIVEKTEESIDTATPDNGLTSIDEDGNVITTINDLYPGYEVNTEVVNTLEAGYKVSVDDTLTFTIDTTDNIATIKVNNLTYLVNYTEGMSFDVMGVSETTTNVIEPNSSNVYVVNPNEVIILNQDIEIVKPHIEIKESSDVIRTTSIVDENGYLNMVLPMYDANNMPIIYQITETKAPEGYAIVEEPTYIYFTVNEDGYAISHILSETINFDIAGPTDLVSPNTDFWRFDFAELFKDAFIEETATEGVDGYAKYIVDVTASWNAATENVDAENFILEVWLNVYNSLITGNLLINKEVNDSNLGDLATTKEYMDTYATNGYDVISKGDFEALQNISPENLNNEETNKAYSDELDNSNYTYVSSDNGEIQYVVTSNAAGIYNLINFDSNIKINGEDVAFDEDNKASVTINQGDLVTFTKGDIAVAATISSSDKEFNEEAGEVIASYTEGQRFTVDANTAGTYFIKFDDADLSYNGYRFTNDEGELKVTLSSGDTIEIFGGSISVKEVITTGIDLALDKEYTGNLTNEETAIIVDNGDITGGNTEWRLWNDETNSQYAYDKTLLASDDGRVYFDGFSILDDSDEAIVYHLQEVGAPAPILAESVITDFTFNIDEEGNLVAATEDVLSYTSAGTVDNITETINEVSVGTFEDAESNEDELVYEVYREDAIFKEIEAEKTVEDESGNNLLEEGENVTYHITVTNNGGLNSEITVQDTLDGLDKWFNIDDKALSQELVINETALEESNPFTQIDVPNLSEALTDGSSITIDNSQAGNYDIVIDAGTIASYNGQTKLYEDETTLNIDLQAGDILSVKSGNVQLVNTEEPEEVESYTLQNLIDGFTYNLDAFTKVDFAFTLTAKDTFESTAYCQTVTNVATITPIYPDKPEIDIDTLEPTIDLPVICIDNGKVDAYKTSYDESGDDIVSKGEKVIYEIGFENGWDIPVENVFVQDNVQEQISAFYDIDMNQKLIVKANDEVIDTDYTLQDLNDGITFDVPANTKMTVTFEVVAKSDLGTTTSEVCESNIECPDIENTATIKVVEPIICTPDENGNIDKDCEDETEELICEPTVDEKTGEVTYPKDCNVTELEVTDTIKVDCEVPLCTIPKKLENTGKVATLMFFIVGFGAGLILLVKQKRV